LLAVALAQARLFEIRKAVVKIWLRVLRVLLFVFSVFLMPGYFGTRRTQREEHGGHGENLVFFDGSVLRWRHADDLSKPPGKIIRILESHGHGDILDRFIGKVKLL
jgi:hypothetical protein